MDRSTLRLTRLEARCVPAVAIWDGGGADNKWTTAANWQNDVEPQPGDDLAFPAGAQQLTNTNDFPGNTAFGSLSLADGYQISGNALTVARGVNANVSAGASATLGISVGGAGGLVKDGLGALDLTGLSSYAGLTDLRAGQLGARSADALGASGAGNETRVAAAAVLSLGVSHGAAIDVPESITFTGRTAANLNPLLLPEFATVTLSGPLTLTGPAEAPTRFAVLDGSRLTITRGVGESGGAQGLQLFGVNPYFIENVQHTLGVIAFAATAVNTYTGLTSVEGGSVLFDGTGSPGPLTVQVAFLGGQGTVGPVATGNAGQLGTGHPENLTATLTTGGLALSPAGLSGAAGSLGVNLLGDGRSNLYDVHGTVRLGGMLYINRLFPADFSPAVGTRYTIIRNDGTDPVEGTFEVFADAGTFRSIPEGGVAQRFGSTEVRVTYRGGDGNDVELFVAPSTAPKFAVGAGPGSEPRVNVYAGNGALLFSFLAYDAAFRGGVNVSLADPFGFGDPYLVTGAGPGGTPHVRVWHYDGAAFQEVSNIFPYDLSFRGGVHVAVGPIRRFGDQPGIVVAPGPGGGPHVRVMDVMGNVTTEFMAYDPSFTGGVNVAISQLQPGGLTAGYIVTAPGPGGGPHVKLFSPVGSLANQFLAYDPSFRGGVSLAVGDFEGLNNGSIDIATGAGAGGAAHVRLWHSLGHPADTGPFAEFLAYDPRFTGGVSVAASDLDGNGAVEVITGAGPGGGPHVEAFRAADQARLLSFYAFDPAFTGGVFVG